MSDNLTPMAVCELLIGRPEEIAAIAGLHAKSAFGWRLGSAWRDAGDLPPRANRALLAHSDRHQLGLTPRHLIYGATRAEIEAVLSARGRSEAAA